MIIEIISNHRTRFGKQDLKSKLSFPFLNGRVETRDIYLDIYEYLNSERESGYLRFTSMSTSI